MGIQVKIFLHRIRPETKRRIRAAQIGFIPNFKKPLPHFSQPIPLCQMFRKQTDQPVPSFIACRPGSIPFIVKNCSFLTFKSLRHKTDLHKRLHIYGQQEIKHRIHIGKRNHPLILGPHHGPGEHTHIIIKKPMEPYIPKAQFPLAFLRQIASSDNPSLFFP